MKSLLKWILILTTGLVLPAAAGYLGVTYIDINPQSFQESEGTITISANGTKIPVLEEIVEDFENTGNFLNLFADSGSRQFTQFTLQSPAAPTVEEYVQLRKCIFAGDCDFTDNRIDLTDQITHSGQQALHFFAVIPTGDYVSKTSLDTTLLHMAEGDQLWFSGYFYVEEGMPRTLADFETSAMQWGPGPRLILFGDLEKQPHLGLELKHGMKPTYRQEGDRITFPRGQWVHILLHLELSSQSDGVIQIWQDCQLIVDALGKNLPKASAVLDRMQVGITATELKTTLYVDDLLLAVNQDEVNLADFCR